LGLIRLRVYAETVHCAISVDLCWRRLMFIDVDRQTECRLIRCTWCFRSQSQSISRIYFRSLHRAMPLSTLTAISGFLTWWAFF